MEMFCFGGTLADSNVLAFRPFVATVDVTMEFYLVMMNITLHFGPFETKESAMEWANVFETEHKEIEAEEDKKFQTDGSLVNFATDPYLRAYIGTVDILQPTRGGREGVIRPNTPIVDAHQVHIYALHACREAIGCAFDYVHDTDTV